MPKRAAIACLLCLLLFPSLASAKAPPAPVQAGKAKLTAPLGGRAALLVPVRYPVELDGRTVRARVRVSLPGASRTYRLATRGSSGLEGRPERRKRFTFVHAIELGKRQTRMVLGGVKPRVRVLAVARLDVDGDGRPEAISRDRQGAHTPRAAGKTRCGSVPQLLAKPGRRISIELPRCGGKLRWAIADRPESGHARLRGGRLHFWPPKRFRGTVAVRLAGDTRRVATTSAASGPAKPLIEIKVGGASGAVVRAMGDSVTAGFGYYDDGSTMSILRLPFCKPAATFYNDACSSNSASTNNKGTKVEYAPDYGLKNNVSWAAQWANEHGIANYKNYAVTGSEPVNWLPGGQLHETAKKIWSEDPDYILMTMGANPLLSEMLFGIDKMGCAIWSDIAGEYRKCIEEAFAGVQLDARLKQLYEELIANTDATIFLMRYHLSVPASALAYTATQIAEMGALLNERIAKVAAEVEPERLRVVTPPHFNVGVDISPVYPSRFSCSRFGYKVDGRSVQSNPTQDELLLSHPLSFCSGPAAGPPWVISGDTGIHPSAAGYAQMASQVPAPVG